MLIIIFRRGCLSRNPSFLSSGGVWTDSDLVWRRHRLQLADDQQRDILRLQREFSVQLSFVSVRGQLVSVWLLVDSALMLGCLLSTPFPALLLSSTLLGGSTWDICHFVIYFERSQVPADSWDTWCVQNIQEPVSGHTL